jgi:hypothetical protein
MVTCAVRVRIYLLAFTVYSGDKLFLTAGELDDEVSCNQILHFHWLQGSQTLPLYSGDIPPPTIHRLSSELNNPHFNLAFV